MGVHPGSAEIDISLQEPTSGSGAVKWLQREAIVHVSREDAHSPWVMTLELDPEDYTGRTLLGAGRLLARSLGCSSGTVTVVYEYLNWHTRTWSMTRDDD